MPGATRGAKAEFVFTDPPYKLGIEAVPTCQLSHLSDAEKRAYVLAERVERWLPSLRPMLPASAA